MSAPTGGVIFRPFGRGAGGRTGLSRPSPANWMRGELGVGCWELEVGSLELELEVGARSAPTPAE